MPCTPAEELPCLERCGIDAVRQTEDEPSTHSRDLPIELALDQAVALLDQVLRHCAAGILQRPRAPNSGLGLAQVDAIERRNRRRQLILHRRQPGQILLSKTVVTIVQGP